MAEIGAHNREPSSDVVGGESSIYSKAEKDLAVMAIADSSVAGVVVEHGASVVDMCRELVCDGYAWVIRDRGVVRGEQGEH